MKLDIFHGGSDARDGSLYFILLLEAEDFYSPSILLQKRFSEDLAPKSRII